MKPVVFAGPSLHGVQLPPDLDLQFAPPAACGDVLKAVREGNTTIGLVDGTFESGPSVWHKEILFALASGCTVLGAASMGAIRAAECAPYGMVGVGRIFEEFSSGKRSVDADVALIHGPRELGYLPLSVALVDVEDALARMQAVGALSPALCDEILGRAKRTFFKARTWRALLSAVEAPPAMIQHVTAWIANNGPGLKGRDALLLIQTINGLGTAKRSQPGKFIETRFFSELVARTGV